LAVYNIHSYWGSHESAQKITETIKSLKICYVYNINRICFKIVHRRTEMAHQRRVSRFGSRVIERAVASCVDVYRLIRSC